MGTVYVTGHRNPDLDSVCSAYGYAGLMNMQDSDNTYIPVRCGHLSDSVHNILEQLGIEIPELYVKLDVTPNGYTTGDTQPVIVLTSGLFETVPEELIPTVIAHECGHIACHHTLFTTMGQVLLNGAAVPLMSALGNVALYPIQMAFAYWMRCSEFSADRAAMICDGSAKNVMEMCMRFAGFDKDIMAEPNLESFMEQAEEYKKMVEDSKYNKTLEFMMFWDNDHPLNAVRAYEAREWEKTERFRNIQTYINSSAEDRESNLPVQLNGTKCIGKKYEDVQAKLMSLGFSNITMVRTSENPGKIKSGNVYSISINGNEEAGEEFYMRDSDIKVSYFEEKTEDEIALEHVGEIRPMESFKYYQGKKTEDVVRMFEEMGFMSIEIKAADIPKMGLRVKEDTVAKVSIGDNEKFTTNDWINLAETVTIYSYTSEK